MASTQVRGHLLSYAKVCYDVVASNHFAVRLHQLKPSRIHFQCTGGTVYFCLLVTEIMTLDFAYAMLGDTGIRDSHHMFL